MEREREPNTADIIIIGGGILGLCTAYYLASLQPTRIALLEQDLLAQASTGLSVGGIRQQFSHPANIRLSQKSLRLLKCFQEQHNEEFRFHKIGYLFLSQSKPTWADFIANVKLQKKHDVPVELLTPDEIKSRWPYLNTSDLLGGTFCPEDGYLDPSRIAMAYAQACRKLGVKIQENIKVVKIHDKNGHISGVQTSQGNISAPIVINTAGAWGGEVARMANLELPVKPFRRQVFITKSFPAIPRPIPMIIDQDRLFYFREEGPAILTGMSDPEEPSSFNTHVNREFLEKLIKIALHRAPILEKAQILRGWAGLYAITPDENPIIGPILEKEGLYCAIGFSGHGFQHGPAVGHILSQLIIKGKASFDLSAFSYTRFKGKLITKAEKQAI